MASLKVPEINLPLARVFAHIPTMIIGSVSIPNVNILSLPTMTILEPDHCLARLVFPFMLRKAKQPSHVQHPRPCTGLAGFVMGE
jgi:hypothetical protein